MVRITEDFKIYIKILIWGIGGTPKSKLFRLFYQYVQNNDTDVKPIVEIEKYHPENNRKNIDDHKGFYFDRGIFQSTKQEKVYYLFYTVAGHPRFAKLRKKIFEHTDGIIFIFNSQPTYFEDNIESLRELKKIAKGRLIEEIPLVIINNKNDSTEDIDKSEIKKTLINLNLWYDSENKLNYWNPPIYEFPINSDHMIEIKDACYDCMKNVVKYVIYGEGYAPDPNSMKE